MDGDDRSGPALPRVCGQVYNPRMVRLHGAMLFVKDLDRMTAFYRDVVGMQPVEDTRLDNWVEFKGDGVQFSLHAIPESLAAGIHIDSPPRARDRSSAKLTFAVQDVEATLKKIEQSGLPLLRRPWGATEAVDPEGNVFAVSAES
jgi:predicted enzyme related to lactoylglutathione lyase